MSNVEAGWWCRPCDAVHDAGDVCLPPARAVRIGDRFHRFFYLKLIDGTCRRLAAKP